MYKGLQNLYKSAFNIKKDYTYLSHAIGAFILAPIYSLFIYQLNVWTGYVWLGFSYTLLFPIYYILCKYTLYFKDKFSHFFTAHIFGVTFISFIGLYNFNFEILSLLYFFSLYALCIVIIKKWYTLMLYNIYVFLLLTYGLMVKEEPLNSELLIVSIFVVFGIVSTLSLHDVLSKKEISKKNSEYFSSIIESSDFGYVYFRYDHQFSLLDYNQKVCSLLNIQEVNESIIQSQILLFLKNDDFKKIKKLVLVDESFYEKEFFIIKHGVKTWIKVKVKRLNSNSKNEYILLLKEVSNFKNTIGEFDHLKNKYNKLYYKNKAGIFTLDKESRIIDCNDSFREMFNFTVDKGKLLFDLYSSNEWDLIIESLGDSGVTKNYQTIITLNNKVEKNLVFNWYFDSVSKCIEGSVIDLTSIQKASKALRQSEEKYKLIYEESNDAILLLEGTIIIDVNRKMTQLMGIVSNELIGTDLFNLSANRNDKLKERFKQIISGLENSKTIKFDWIFNGKNKIIEAEVTLNEIMFDKKLYYQCVIHDNTLYNNNLRALKKNQKNLENILENNPEGILIISGHHILYSNSSAELLIGNKVQFDKIFISEDQIKFEEIYKEHFKDGKRKNIQLIVLNTKNEELLIDVTIVKTSYEEENASLIILKDVSAQKKLDKEKLRAELAEETNKQLAKEIKERIKTELLLEEQYLRTKAIIESSNYTFLLTLDLKGNVTSINKHFKTYFKNEFNINVKEKENYKTIFKSIISEKRLFEFSKIIKSVQKGESFQFEVRMVNNNINYWLEVFVSPIFDVKGNVTELSLVAHDSSEKKKVSISIEKSLREKEILLKEIHHRVKNNLQVISSILNLQSSFVTDENTLEILQESRSRIRSMAMIHENLYKTEDFSSISFSEYLETLSRNLITSYRINEEVNLLTNLESVYLILDQAIPCALLVNELITNSLKYAWKQGENGIITINLFQKNNNVYLEIFDNGIGLPGDYDTLKSETLGLQLVETLVEQLDGKIKVESEKGTKFFIKFENSKNEINA